MLTKLKPDEVFFTREDAYNTLSFFFGNPDNLNPDGLTQDDVAFAQALLMEAVVRSEQMGFVHSIFSTAMKPPTSFAVVARLAVLVAKHAASVGYKRSSGANVKDPKIYQSVRDQLARNFKSVWKIRLQTGELIY